MSVTASRLGHSPITLDWTNLVIGTGHPDSPKSETRPSFAEAWGRQKALFDKGEVAYYNCPMDPTLTQVHESEALAQKFLNQDRFTDCLLLGIGGSALGPISLITALQDRATTKMRFHFMENPDPNEWRATVDFLHPDKTLVVVVTKSGGTFETLAQTLLALEWLGRERWKTNMVAITDPERGDLRNFAKNHDIPSLSIAPSMGGRFSVFTPVGLFPAALAGLNLKDFLSGAALVREQVEKVPAEKNPVFILAAELIRQFPKRPIHVCMPYSSRLRSLSSWFVQLWAESLGKDGKGFTPLAALGATDQHSILQLLRDGPDDKVTLFLTVDKVDQDVTIPRPLRNLPGINRLPAFQMLEGHSLQQLLRVEYRATSLVLTRRGRPHVTFQMDRLDEKGMGAVYFAFSVMTSFAGSYWGVNPYDQPGVEEGKVYIREALGQEAREAKALPDENSPVARLRREQM